MTPPRVLVVGSINIDEAIRVARLPAPGETAIAADVERGLGGKGANQAVAAARAGATVTMVGAVGDDGSDLLSALADDGINTAGVARVPERDSGRALVLIDDSAENSIVVLPGANRSISDSAIDTACGRLRPGDVLLLQNEVPTANSARAARRAHDAGAAVIWNAAPAPRTAEEIIPDIDVLVVNETELRQVAMLVDAGTADADVERMTAAVSERLHVDVVCTLGAAGAAYLLEGARGTLPADRVEAVDTTAAGDTFVGYLAAGTGLPPVERVRIALAAATLAVTRQGATASVPHRLDVEHAVEARTERNHA